MCFRKEIRVDLDRVLNSDEHEETKFVFFL